MRLLTILITVLSFTKIQAVASTIEKRTFGGYTLEVQMPCNKEELKKYNLSKFKKCFPDTASARVLDQTGKVITSFPNSYYRHYHPFEVYGSEIFWIVRTGDLNSEKNWTDELWVRDLKSGKQSKLLSFGGIDFRASPNGQTIVFIKGEDALVLDRGKSATTLIAKKGDGGSDEGFTLLDWSTDGTKFWLGSGVIDTWSTLGVYQNEKVTWLPQIGNCCEGALNTDLGWFAMSDAPHPYEWGDREKFLKSKQTVRLFVADAFTGKKIQIAEQKANYFEPKWDASGKLLFSVDGKQANLSREAIEKKFK